MPEQKQLPLRGGWVARQEIRTFSNVTNDWEPWVGSDLKVRFSQFKSGFDFNGYPSTIIGPYNMAATGEPGWYFATIGADDIYNAFKGRVNQTVYQIVEGAYGSSTYALTNSTPLLVVDDQGPVG